MVRQITIAVAIIGVAVGIRVYLNTRDPLTSFDMLAYIDGRIARQEDEKDVRCWSSVSKLQMFLADAPIAPTARAIRIEGHRQLIQSLWHEAQARSDGDNLIDGETVAEIIARRFPMERDPTGTVRCSLDSPPGVLFVGPADYKDYNDTIEPWRLLQSWTLQHTDDSGRVTLDPPFSQEALDEIKEFLLVYDIMVMRYAKHLARERRRQTIDDDAMKEAFTLDSKLVAPSTGS